MDVGANACLAGLLRDILDNAGVGLMFLGTGVWKESKRKKGTRTIGRVREQQ